MEEMQVSCSGEQGFMNQEFERCIRCNKPTPYHPNTPITLRRYYVEGSGQLCPLCYQELYGVAGALGVPFGSPGLPQTSDEKRTDNYSK